jgi:predicted DNA binding CopG/RHH family protein
MTVTIQLPSDIEADLAAQARAQGLELQQYVEHLLRAQAPGERRSPSDMIQA